MSLRGLMALAIGVLALLILPVPAAGQSVTNAPTRLELGGASPTRTTGLLVLRATLTTEEGRAMGDRKVDFYRRLEFFGTRDAHLGSAITDSSGEASLAYLPAEVGREMILVRFAGGAGLAPAQGSGEIEVGEAVRPFESEPLPLAILGRWLPLVLAALVVATWAVLLGVFLSTTVGIKAAVRRVHEGAPVGRQAIEEVTAP